MWEKNSAEVRLIHAEQIKEKNRKSWRLNNSSKLFLNQLESMGFHKLITKSLKWMMKEFIDHATCPVSILFCKYYFKLYVNVHEIIADNVFNIYSRRSTYCDTNKKYPQNFKFYRSIILRLSRNFWDWLSYSKKKQKTWGWPYIFLLISHKWWSNKL